MRYLGPALKSEQFLQNVAPKLVDGMVGVSSPLASDSDLLRHSSRTTGAASALSHAYFFFDAIALVGLASEAAAIAANASPTSEQIRDQVQGVSRSQGRTVVGWYQLDTAIEMVRDGTPVDYRGVTGSVDLDASGTVTQGLAQLRTISSGNVVDGELVLAQPR